MSCSCSSNSCDPAHEPLPSTVDNFVTQFFGEVTKTCHNGKVEWTLPCNLDAGIPNYPRVPGEGLACYFSRVLEDISAGGGGGGGGDALQRVNNLSDLTSVPTARSNLGLGTMALQSSSNVNISGGSITNAQLINPAITGGVVSTAIISNSTLNGATISSGTIGALSITGAAISGGTIANAAISGGTITGASVKSLPAPVLSGDAVPKSYADSLASGLYVLSPVKVATNGINVLLGGGAPSTVDMISLSLGDRVLVKDQINAVQNGVYTVTSVGTGSNGTWTRSTDADTNGELKKNSYVFVNQGTVNASTSWVITSPDPINIGTDAINWTKFFSVSSISFGSIGGTINPDQIADGTIGGTKFASGIKPIEIVSELPSTGNFQGRVVFLTQADGTFEANKLYRWTSSVVTTGKAYWTAAVPAVDVTGTIGNGQIADGSISGTKFASGLRPIEVVNSLPAPGTVGRVVFLTTNFKIYRDTGTAWTAEVPAIDVSGTISSGQIADGSIAGTKFASGIKPIEVLNSLPAAGTAGRVVFLTTDNKLYRDTGSTWTAAVPAADVTGTINTIQIANTAITSDKIATNAVTAEKITANSVTADKIAANSVTADKIAANAITSDKIAANAITSGMIQAGAITATQIAAGAITAGKLATDSVTATNIAAGSIVADKIATNAITSSKIAADAITTGMIQAGAITATQIASSGVTADKIAANAVTAAKIAAGAIESDKIATNAITSDKITANAITSGMIQAGAISASQIAAGAVTAIKLASNSVTADAIAANSVSAGKISVSSLSAINANLGTVSAGTFKSDPSVTFSTGVGFFIGQDTDTIYKMRVGDPATNSFSWNGSQLVVKGLLAASEIDHACMFIRPPGDPTEGGQIFLQMPIGVAGAWAMDVSSNNLRLFIEGNPLLAGAHELQLAGDLRIDADTYGGGDIFASNITITGYGFGDFTTFSSRQFKENDAPITGALNKVLQLAPIDFDWKKDSPFKAGQHDVGLIAEDVEAIFPQLVTRDENNRPAVNYAKLSVYLIAAIKELNAKLA